MIWMSLGFLRFEDECKPLLYGFLIDFDLCKAGLMATIDA